MKLQKYVLVTAALTGSLVASAWTTTALDKSHILKFHSSSNKKSNVLQSTPIGTATTESELVPETTLEPQQNEASLAVNPVQKLFEPQHVKAAASVLGGTVLTFALNNLLSLGPVKASSVTALVATLVLPEKLALAALCGSFAGMATVSVIPGVSASVVLGGVCAGTMALFDRKKWLIGVGGRLGFIAQCACTSQFLVSSYFYTPASSVKLIGAYPGIGQLLSQLAPISFFTVAGALFMRLWKESLTKKSKIKPSSAIVDSLFKRLSTSVAAVGATGLVASLFPPSIAGPAFCGSFIAMSSPAKLETYGSLVGASVMGGVSQLILAGALLGGWGGKLGTASLLGVILYNMLASARISVLTKKASTTGNLNKRIIVKRSTQER
jgi:hypothetical protein